MVLPRFPVVGSGERRDTNARCLARNNDPRAHANALIQIKNISVEHANTAVRHKSSDGPRRVRPVNGVFVLGQNKCSSTHRVSWRAARDYAGQQWAIAADLGGGRPRWADVLAG